MSKRSGKRCRVLGCGRKLSQVDKASEQVCADHRLMTIRLTNERITCWMKGCNKIAGSSGYCTAHTQHMYVQRLDLLPENNPVALTPQQERECVYCGMQVRNNDFVCSMHRKSIESMRTL